MAKQNQNEEALALPPGVAAPVHANLTTTDNLGQKPDVDVPPDASPERVAAVARINDMSGNTLKVVLASGEGKEGQEAQFVRVNEKTWLVPRNVEVIVPEEVYEVLTNTAPPIPEGMENSAAYNTRRFAVSVLQRYPYQVPAAVGQGN